jgi:2-dehydropantoate 2-reductase
MRLLIVGPGAIGGTLTACLSQQGVEVSLLVRDQDTKYRLQKSGLKLVGIRGSFLTHPRICTLDDLQDMEPIQGCLVATKANHLQEVVQRTLPFLHREGFFCSLQNGMTDPLLVSLVGQEKAVGSIITWGATHVSSGVFRLTAEGDLTLGSIGLPTSPFVAEGIQILNQAFPTKWTDQLLPLKFSKLLINSCMTSMGALSGLDLGPTLKHSKAREIFIAILREGLEVASAMDICVPPFGKHLDYYAFMKGTGLLSQWRRHALIQAVGFKYRRLTSSSLQSLRKGQPTEVDYLNGYLVEQGKKYGLSLPVNEKICSLIHQIEKGTLPMALNNLEQISLP